MIRSSLDARIPNRPDQQVHFTDDAVRSLIGQKVTLHACGEGNDGDYPPVGKAVVASASVDSDGSVVIHLEVSLDDETGEKTLRELVGGDPEGVFSSEAAVHESRSECGESRIDAVELLSMWPSAKPPKDHLTSA